MLNLLVIECRVSNSWSIHGPEYINTKIYFQSFAVNSEHVLLKVK